MFNESDEAERTLLGLSALADGELDPAATLRACEQWRGDAAARASWHAYHVIGDVMRSDDLSSDTARDAGFLNGLRIRLASEPVVLCPPAGAARASGGEPESDRGDAGASRRAWWGPAAVAAGFMVVASTLVLTRGSAPFGGAGDSLAEASVRERAVVATAPASAAEGSGELQTLVADGQLIRDARLERYFAAHSQFGGSSALGVPSGFLRAATTQAPGR